MDIDKLSKYFGGDAALANALGVTQGAISQWRSAKAIPKMRVYQIQILTAGKFRAQRKKETAA